MTRKDSDASAKDNPLVRALARWEWEGGHTAEPDSEQLATLIQDEEHIFHCLGMAVILRWNNLPVDIPRALFSSATSLSDPLPKAELKEQVARFLHSHKNAW